MNPQPIITFVCLLLLAGCAGWIGYIIGRTPRPQRRHSKRELTGGRFAKA